MDALVGNKALLAENKALLTGRWRFLRSQEAGAYRDICMDAESAAILRDLDPKQVDQAADTEVPLFRLAVPDYTLEKLLSSDPGVEFEPSTEADRVINAENRLFLFNRWHAAAISDSHAHSVYGLSSNTIRLLRNAGYPDIERAGARGCVLAAYAAKPRYLFHGGKNVALNRLQRTSYASCCISRRAG